jgi:hypothetical protein
MKGEVKIMTTNNKERIGNIACIATLLLSLAMAGEGLRRQIEFSAKFKPFSLPEPSKDTPAFQEGAFLAATKAFLEYSSAEAEESRRRSERVHEELSPGASYGTLYKMDQETAKFTKPFSEDELEQQLNELEKKRGFSANTPSLPQSTTGTSRTQIR